MVKYLKQLAVLQNKSFALLWSGQSISFFGLAIYNTCLPFLVFHTGGDAIELGLANTFFIIPQIVFLLISGVYVDRWPKRRVLIICDMIRGGAVLGITLLIITDTLLLVHIYILTALMGFISTFYRPALRGIIPKIVKKEQIIPANSLRSISQQISEMVGPVIGGMLVAAIGLYIAYGINTVTFLLSALFVFFVSIKSNRTNKVDEPEENRLFLDGFQEMVGMQFESVLG